MNKLISLIFTLLVAHVVKAEGDTIRVNGRLRDRQWYRYEKGTKIAAILPSYGLVTEFGGANNRRIVSLGVALEGGVFPIDKLHVSVTLFYAYHSLNFASDANIQGIQINSRYFFNDKWRVSPYIGLSGRLSRFSYTSTPELFYLRDDPNYVKTIHVLPLVVGYAGASIKCFKRATIQAGLYGAHRLYDHSQSVGSAGSPAFSPVGFWTGYLYHFR